MKFPITTSQAARLLATAESRLINFERSGKIQVEIIVGRRAWSAENILTAAKLLGKDTAEVRNLCTEGPVHD